MDIRKFIWGILAILSCSSCATAQLLPAFPGAEGFGRYTTGGRGGKVLIVRNLDDEGPGSLRWAVQQKYPRTIVFAVSGTIALRSPLKINYGNCTIAGQSAPGDGICVRNYNVNVNADNVIIRYMRFRLGDEFKQADDAMTGIRHRQIIIDHCSMSWAVDENASFYDNQDFTLQYCIIAESMRSSVHPKGEHGYGGIWGGQRASFHHNILANNSSRNPRFCGARYTHEPEKEIVDFRNNVIFNWVFNSAYGGEGGNYNIVDNYYKAGPATNKKVRNRILNPADTPYGKFYVNGNYVDGYTDITQDNWAGGVHCADKTAAKRNEPVKVIAPSQQTAVAAYAEVLEKAGASLHRDAVDERIIAAIRSGVTTTGKDGIIDSQKDVGGWPALNSLPAPLDSDEDGMPDDWETAWGLDKNNAADAVANTLDKRYTNIEVYLNSLLPSSGPAMAQNVEQPVFKKDTFSIARYGAKADGVTLNTRFIQSAIDDCNRKGGGVVLVPAGLWLTGPITLKSNVNLHLQQSALLQFTADKNQYPLVEGNWEGLEQMRNQSPISATRAENIAITGQGIIDGNGDVWRVVKKDKLTESQWKKLVASGGVLSDDSKTWYPSEGMKKGSRMKNPGVISPDHTAEHFQSIRDFLRPNLLVLTQCKKILLEGVVFQNSPAWCLHTLLCDQLTVRNIFVKNPWYAQNGDGIDVESCKNVLIEGSTFDVGDDAICIKSGRDEAGRKRGVPTENVWVRHNLVYHAHGGFVIGSEMSGGARNIYVEDCTFMGTDIGLRFKTTRGRGGVVENIHINRINMKDIVAEAILFDMYYMAKDPVLLAGEQRDAPKVEEFPVTEATPQFRNFSIKNVVCEGAGTAIFIRGLPEMNIRQVSLQDMVLKAKKGVEVTEAKDITLKNIRIITGETSAAGELLNKTF